MDNNNSEISLTKEEISRYSRHLILPEFGFECQLKLKKSIFKLFDKKSMEYLDFYYFGIPNLYIR